MLDLTIEEKIYLNACANNGVQKGREDVLRNLKLTYTIGNGAIKDDVKPLIKRVESMSNSEYEELMAQMPFETWLPDDMLHDEILDYGDEE